MTALLPPLPCSSPPHSTPSHQQPAPTSRHDPESVLLVNRLRAVDVAEVARRVLVRVDEIGDVLHGQVDVWLTGSGTGVPPCSAGPAVDARGRGGRRGTQRAPRVARCAPRSGRRDSVGPGAPQDDLMRPLVRPGWIRVARGWCGVWCEFDGSRDLRLVAVCRGRGLVRPGHK